MYTYCIENSANEDLERCNSSKEFNYIEKLSEYFLNSPMNIENISVFLRS